MSVRVLIGDALDQMRSLDSSCVQCCVTSPPYWGLRDYGTAAWEGGDAECGHKGRVKPRQDTHGAGTEHGRFSATRGTQPAKSAYAVPVRELCGCGARRVDAQIGLEATPDEYIAKLVAVFAEVRRVLRDDGTFWLNLGDSYSGGGHGGGGSYESERTWRKGNPEKNGGASNRDGLGRVTNLPAKNLIGIPWRVAFALQADGWYLRSDIIWAKPNPMPESVRDRPTKSHEYVFLLSKSERYYYDADAIAEPVVRPWDSSNGHVGRNGLATENGGQRNPQTGAGVVDRNARSVWTITTKPYTEAHFATMPVELAQRCIRAGSKPGDTILDPFGGAGTTGLAADGLGRHAIMIELNPTYAAMAKTRVTSPLFEEASA